MKSKPSVFCLLAGLFLLSAASAIAQGKVTLSGTIKNPKEDKVYLKTITDRITYTENMESATLDRKGNFSMTVSLKQPAEAILVHADEQTSLYLSPGDKLTLTLNTAEFDESLKYSGKGAVINNYIAQQMLRKEDSQRERVQSAGLKEKEFLHFQDSVEKADLAFINTYAGKVKNQSDAEKRYFESQKEATAFAKAKSKLQYPQFHSMINGLGGRYSPEPGFFSFLESMQISRDDAEPSASYLDFAESYVHYLASNERLENAEVKEQPYQLVVHRIINDNFGGKTKAYLQTTNLYQALTMRGGEGIDEPLMNSFRKETSRWPEYISIVDKAYNQALTLMPGNPAPDFSATTPGGKSVSLRDFRGKIVYVDVWASWCGPCVAEIPAAKALLRDFANQDVVFLNVSVDQSEEAWRAAMAKHDVEGTNALAKGAFSSDLAKNYNIRAIPKYMLIDREGNIVNVDAGRPRSTAKAEIEAALRK